MSFLLTHLPSPRPGAEFAITLAPSQMPLLDTPRVGGVRVVPAVVYLHALQEASHRAFGWSEVHVTSLSLEEAVVLGERAEVLRLVLEQPQGDVSEFGLWSQPTDTNSPQWRKTASGALCAAPSSRKSPRRVDVAGLRARLDTHLTGSAFYEQAWPAAFKLGPALELVRDVWTGAGEALGQVEAGPACKGAGVPTSLLLLDAAVQVSLAAIGPGSLGTVYMGTGQQSSVILESIGEGPLLSHAQRVPGSPDTRPAFDLTLMRPDGRVVAEVKGAVPLL